MSNLKRRIEADSKIEDGHMISPFPKNMLLEPTNACNDSCLFCANSKCTKRRGMIDKELAKRILKEAYESGTREVGFYGTGEPLLNKDLEMYIAYAKELGYEYVYITTNGALLSKERAQSIVESGIDSIKFSINAPNAKDYLLIHGRDDFDKVIENLIYLSMLRKDQAKNFLIYISYILTRYTYKHKDEFKNKYMQYVDDIVFYDCLNTGGYMSNEITPFLSVDNVTKVFFENDICPMIFKNLYVTYEGYLTMCCADFQNYLVIADLNKENIEDAWNNQYAQKLRKQHLEHNLKGTLCYNCINNCVDDIKPLREEYAVNFNIFRYDNSEKLQKRFENMEH